MNSRIEYWRKKLEELENRVTSVQKISTVELIEWSAECVSTFSILGVNSDIIRGFMNLFEHGHDDIKGPQKIIFDYWQNPSRQKDRIKGFFYPNVAFTTARLLIESLEETERLVPNSLIKIFENHSSYGHIATSLESMQRAFEQKDPISLLNSSQSILQSVINIEPQLQTLDKQGLKRQLNFLLDSKNINILNKFGVGTELVEIFHNFRYLRNKASQHINVPLPHMPLAVSLSFAHLVLIFINGTLTMNQVFLI